MCCFWVKARHFSQHVTEATWKSAGDLGLLHGVLRTPAKTGTLFPFLGLSGDGDRLFLAPVSQLENSWAPGVWERQGCGLEAEVGKEHSKAM